MKKKKHIRLDVIRLSVQNSLKIVGNETHLLIWKARVNNIYEVVMEFVNDCSSEILNSVPVSVKIYVKIGSLHDQKLF